MYLEPIFTSEDITVQLPVEARRYNAMERNWRRIMKNAKDNPYVISITILIIFITLENIVKEEDHVL